jgi:lysophosphatidate acyltransferase
MLITACAVLSPIPTKGLTTADVDELTRSTRELMLKELITLSEKAQNRPLGVAAAVNQPTKAVSSGIDTTVSSI